METRSWSSPPSLVHYPCAWDNPLPSCTSRTLPGCLRSHGCTGGLAILLSRFAAKIDVEGLRHQQGQEGPRAHRQTRTATCCALMPAAVGAAGVRHFMNLWDMKPLIAQFWCYYFERSPEFSKATNSHQTLEAATLPIFTLVGNSLSCVSGNAQLPQELRFWMTWACGCFWEQTTVASQDILVADGHLSSVVTTRVLCTSISVTSEVWGVGLSALPEPLAFWVLTFLVTSPLDTKAAGSLRTLLCRKGLMLFSIINCFL